MDISAFSRLDAPAGMSLSLCLAVLHGRFYFNVQLVHKSQMKVCEMQHSLVVDANNALVC